ncbi:hypothetical protein ACG7TL_004896 [Trametes sanguinea]
MTGAMWLTATNVLEAHASVLPFRLPMDLLCQRAAVRLCILPSTHPLHSYVLRAYRYYVKSHRDPLHQLMKAYRGTASPVGMKEVQPTRRHPRWRPLAPHAVGLAISKGELLESDSQWMAKQGAVRVYSDGSEAYGVVGAAAVL